jgi:hypothetical protein
VRKLLAHLIIVIDYTKVQALKFLLKSELNKTIPMERCLLTIQPHSLGALPGGRRGLQTRKLHGGSCR